MNMISQAHIRAIRDAAYLDDEYAWIITRDRFHELDPEQESEVGTTGPRDATNEMVELARTVGVPFRMLDEGDIDHGGDFGVTRDHADYGVVYEGMAWFARGDDSGQEFGPLDDFGGPNYGCIEIQYLNGNGTWVTL